MVGRGVSGWEAILRGARDDCADTVSMGKLGVMLLSEKWFCWRACVCFGAGGVERWLRGWLGERRREGRSDRGGSGWTRCAALECGKWILEYGIWELGIGI